MEIPVGNRIILRKEGSYTKFSYASGVEIDTSYRFANISHIAPGNPQGFKIGDLVCVPAKKVKEIPVISTGAIEFICFASDVEYVKTSDPEKSSDRTF
jgi:hypothetical protein